MLDNVVSPITCVSMNHQNQLEQMANGAMFATKVCRNDEQIATASPTRIHYHPCGPAYDAVDRGAGRGGQWAAAQGRGTSKLQGCHA
jgi:hypothetical protein